MKKNGNKSANGRTASEVSEGIRRRKSHVTAGILQYNHVVSKVTEQISDGIKAVSDLAGRMDGQRGIQARMASVLRVMNSAARLLSQGKAHLWMIDDDAIEELERNGE